MPLMVWIHLLEDVIDGAGFLLVIAVLGIDGWLGWQWWRRMHSGELKR